MKKKIILILLSIGIIISCKKTKTNEKSSETRRVKIGSTIKLSKNENVEILDSVSNNVFNVNFSENVNDNRCSKQSCFVCYGSFAYVKLNFINTNSSVKSTIPLSLIGCVATNENEIFINQGKDTLGYKFQLQNVFPYPDTSILINENDYKLTLKIERI